MPVVEAVTELRLELARRETRSAVLPLTCDAPLTGLRVAVDPALAGPAGWDFAVAEPVGTRDHGPRLDALIPLVGAVDLPAGDHEIWIRATSRGRAGRAEGGLRLTADGFEHTVPVALRVDPVTLPDPADFAFYLDLWQQPTAVADELGLERWSDAHLHALAPYLTELAALGQKPITCTILDEPWGHQTEPDFPSMVRWRRDDGVWSWDFEIFDRYVELALACGLPGPISCYSLVLGPGPRTDCVLPNDAGEPVACEIGDAVYVEAMAAFLRAFVAHLRRRGWLQNTQIGFDEKPGEVMRTAIGLVRREAPELKIALAGNWMPEYDADIDDYCVIFPGPPPEASAARRARGAITTFYTCCGPPLPNTFVHSPPLEVTLLGWHAAAIGCDGYLRWAYNSWPRAARTSADWGPWPPGDCYLVYRGPAGPLRTRRWERLREGIQDYELIRLARAAAARGTAADRSSVEQAVAEAVAELDGHRADPEVIVRSRRTLREVVVRLAGEHDP